MIFNFFFIKIKRDSSLSFCFFRFLNPETTFLSQQRPYRGIIIFFFLFFTLIFIFSFLFFFAIIIFFNYLIYIQILNLIFNKKIYNFLIIFIFFTILR